MSSSTVEVVSPIERKFRVEVPPQEVEEELADAYRQLSTRVKVPGFRPGKIPRRILEGRFHDQVESDVIQHLVEHSFNDALQQNPDVHPVAPPRVTNEGLRRGEPFRYVAHVEVKPKIEAKDYQGLTLKKVEPAVSDERVGEELERLRQSMSQLVALEGRDKAAKGDFAVVDYQGLVEGKPFPGSRGEGAVMEVAEGPFVEGKAGGLEGAAVGEAREIEHAFPADWRVTQVAGKAAKFQVTLKGLKQRNVPALDDALAKEVGMVTLEDLKTRIRKELTEQDHEKAEREARQELLRQLIEKNPFEVPGSMVERAADHMIEASLERFARQGIDPSKLRLDVDRLRDSLRGPATVEVKGALLLEAIALQEKIECSDEDLDHRFKEMAERMKAPVEKVRAAFADRDERLSLALHVREEKTVAFLKSKAKAD